MDGTLVSILPQALLGAVVLTAVGARLRRWRGLRTAVLLVVVATAWALLGGLGVRAVAETVTHPRATDPGDPCPAGAPVQTFDVSLINIPIFLNRFADVVPEGRMYILDENIALARETFANAADPYNPEDVIEPLTLRVHRGDCVEVNFTNRLNEPAPNFDRDASIFTLPGETLLAPGTVTPDPREFAPALTQPKVDFDPASAPPASMHFDGLVYDVRGSDGAAVGNNPDSTAPAGATVTYRLHADQEGEFHFKDAADLSSVSTGADPFIGSTTFGAFGGIVVEPPGTTWVDVSTGQPIVSGTKAIIKDPDGPDHREHVIYMHDEVEAEPGILTRFCIPPNGTTSAGDECIDPTDAQLSHLQEGTLPALGGGDADALVNGEVPVKLEWFAFNYRSEPSFNREEIGCPARDGADDPYQAPACVGEETALSSWAYGDPGGGDLVFHSYRGEPTSLRLFHSAEYETHTFHWHVNRWPSDLEDEGGIGAVSDPSNHTTTTNVVDVQAVSPGSHYQIVPQGGTGSAHDGTPASKGDIIFHCHLYPHFAAGMWGLNRAHDVLEDGSRTNPDGTPIPALVPLEDYPQPPSPTSEEPGYPFFVPGEFGYKAPKPPLGVPDRQAGGSFPPTTLEQNAADPGAQVAGGYFRDPCPDTWADGTPTPLKVFDVAAIQLKTTYNDDLEWSNPQHRMYVLQEHKADVLSGARAPEPFAPLLNVGDCVEYHLTNELPATYGGTVYDREQVTNEVGIHQHLVQFDVLTSDGAANGWNYDQGADPNQTIVYRDFVSEDIATNSFHDHFFANVHQDAGMFGGATVHQPGCTFHDPVTGDPVKVGTIVDIRCTATTDYHGASTDGADHRNFALFVEDHVPMFQPENPDDPNDDAFVTPFGVPIFPPPFPSSGDDSGVMGVNYRLEPFEARRGEDPAKLFDSKTHGDPATPLPRAFAGDPVKFRLFQLSQEESHGFNLDRWRWKEEPRDPDSAVVQAQHVGMLEAFDVKIVTDKEDPNPSGLELRDYLYNYGGADDWFLGTWGLFRVAGCNPNDLAAYKAHGLAPLQPLPDNQVANCKPKKPPTQRTVGNPCPTTSSGTISAPVKRFDVVAIHADTVYNEAGDHDPHGLAYVLKDDLTAIQSGLKPLEPLVIRANAGDCLEVTLENQLDPARMHPHCFEATEPGQLGFVDPSSGKLTLPDCLHQPPDNPHNVPGFKPFPVSSRVSLNPRLVNYHAGSMGANVGLNFDSTVGPGESILYRWYAPDETGLGVLLDKGDVQNHLHHGLYGGLVIEPEGSSYLDPTLGTALTSGQNAVIADPNGPDFREHVVLMNSDLSLFREDGMPVADNLDLALQPSHEADDPEDQGEFSIGYRNEPWSHRAATNDDLSLIFSSYLHGDPATPLFRAYAGDPVRFRVAQPQGDPRSTSFVLHGHRWRRSPNDPQSPITASQGQFNPAVTYNVHLDPTVYGGAGGPQGYAGDYLYRSGVLLRHLNAGQWGIFRVHGEAQADLISLPDRK